MLAKVGFREEGLLQRYLEVDGAWRDHLLVAITVEELNGSAASALVRAGHAHWAVDCVADVTYVTRWCLSEVNYRCVIDLGAAPLDALVTDLA